MSMERLVATRDLLLARVDEIAPVIREHAAEAELGRSLARPAIDAMREAELFRMSRPTAFGGLELDPVSSFRVVEEVSRHDSAAGWNLNLSVALDYVLAWFPGDGVEEILSNRDREIGGIVTAQFYRRTNAEQRRDDERSGPITSVVV